MLALSLGDEKALDLVKDMLALKPNLKISNKHKESILHLAFKFRKPHQVLDILLTHDVDPNSKDGQGKTALHYAAKRRTLEGVGALLKAGSNVNAVDNLLRTPLHYATNASTDSIDIVASVEEILLEAGANVNAADKALRTPLHYAFVKMDCEELTDKLDPINIVSLLCRNTAKSSVNVNLCDKFGRTALHYAAQRGATLCSIFLTDKERGANLEAVDEVRGLISAFAYAP